MGSVLHHVADGSGPVVVLLHAGVADLRMWDAQVPDLARTHRVVRCDLRGFGRSPLSTGDAYSDAEDVLALLDHLGVGEYSLVAASYGGHVGLQVATAEPGRVERMVLLSPAAELVEPDAELRAFGAEEGRLLGAGDVTAATELNVRTWLGPDADDEARALVRAMQRDAFESQLAADDVTNRELAVDPGALAAPATVVTGAHDLGFFGRTARELVARLPDADLLELPWAGHLPTLERPEEGTRLLAERLSPPRRS